MQRIESLDIHNFRGIKEGHIEGFADVNVLVGRNNSGKTSVLEAISTLAIEFGQMADVLGRDMLGYWTITRRRPHVLLKNVELQKKATTVKLRMTDSDKKADFVFNATGSGKKEVDVRGIEGKRFLEFINSATVFAPQDACNSDIERTLWDKLLLNRNDKYLTSALNSIFNMTAESFQIIPDGRLILLFDNYSVPFESQGDGARVALRTLMILCLLQKSALMLEEPECYQHPGSLERFALALCKLAKLREVQLFVTTHSIECVKAFMNGAKQAESEGALFHLKLEDGMQQARRLDADAIETLNATGVDVRYLDLYA